MRLFLFLIFMLIAFSGAGQVSSVFNGDNGLAQGFVSTVIQDRNGFIWAGTQNGLSRFDGTRFKNYYTSDASSYSLTSNKIHELLVDKTGHLWVANGNNIQWFDNDKGVFVLPEYFKTHKPEFFKDAFIDEQNGLWILQKDNLICLKIKKVDDGFDLEKTLFITFEKNRTQSYNVVFADDSSVWVGTNTGVDKYDKNTGNALIVALPHSGKVCQIWKDKTFGGIWVQMNNGAAYLDKQIFRWFAELKSSSYLKFEGAFGSKSTFIATRSSIFEWNGQSLVVRYEDFKVNLVSACLDDHGNMWVGSNGMGLFQINMNEKPVQAYWKGEMISEPVYKDINGQVYGLKKRGCGKIYSGKNQPALSEAQFSQFAIDDRGEWWALQCDNTLINQYGNHWRLTNISPADNVTRMRCIAGEIIMLVKNREIVFFDPNLGREICLKNQLENPIMVSTQLKINSIKTDTGGKVWAGTDDGLLEITINWDAKNCTTKFYPKNQVLPDLEILATETANNMVWLGTLNGFYCFNPDTRKVNKITGNVIQPNEVVYCMQKDQHGNLWLGTNAGLKMYDPVSQVSRWFSVSDGLPANEFNRNTESLSNNGEILMGTVGGGIRFYPGDLNTSDKQKRMVLTDVFLNQSDTVQTNWKMPIAFEEGNQITLYYSLLDFLPAHQHRYRYRMIGLSDQWQESDNASVTYAHMAPGVYKFEVCGSDGKTDWSTPVIVELSVRRHWWKTAMAIAGMILLIGIALGAFLIAQKSAKPILENSYTEPQENKAIPHPENPARPATNNPHLLQDKVMELIELCFGDSEFNVQTIQEKLKISKVHLHRKMMEETGKTAAWFLKKRRMEEAIKLLKEQPEMSVSEIAYASGYNDPNYFSTVFSSNFGLSPKSYRQNLV